MVNFLLCVFYHSKKIKAHQGTKIVINEISYIRLIIIYLEKAVIMYYMEYRKTKEIMFGGIPAQLNEWVV